jgi:hypothetical protein
MGQMEQFGLSDWLRIDDAHHCSLFNVADYMRIFLHFTTNTAGKKSHAESRSTMNCIEK